MRNRQLAKIAFPHGNVPKYGTAMLEPQFCGKWGVRIQINVLINDLCPRPGSGGTAQRMAKRCYQQGLGFHEICEVVGDARVPSQ